MAYSVEVDPIMYRRSNRKFDGCEFICAVYAIFPLPVWSEMVGGRRFSANIRCTRSTVDARLIRGHFGDRPTLAFSTSSIVETGSSFQRQNGNRWTRTLYRGRIGSRWLRVYLYGFRHISISGLAGNGFSRPSEVHSSAVRPTPNTPSVLFIVDSCWVG